MSARKLSHILDWNHARIGRLEAGHPENGRHSVRAEELGIRLSEELCSGRMPFISMPFRADLEKELPQTLKRIGHCRHMLLLGMGGSALGARALQQAFFPDQQRPGHEGPWLWIADNVDANTLEAWLAKLPVRETAVVVVSKSGDTIETLALYFLIREWLRTELGEDWKKNVVMVTDAARGYLRAEAGREDLFSLTVPENLGGRYSVLSAVGLLPAAFLGIEWKKLLKGAADLADPLICAPVDLKKHPAWELAVWNRQLMENAYSELIYFSYIPLLSAFGPWFAQLWAESLGKSGKGSMPLPATGVADQHSLLQMFLDGPSDKGCLFIHCPELPKGRIFGAELPEAWAFLRGHSFGDLLEAEGLGTRMALFRNKVPSVEIRMSGSDEEAAGHLIMLLELTTLLTGWLLEVNPLDQPAVELAKIMAKARLGAPGYEEERRALDLFMRRQGRESVF